MSKHQAPIGGGSKGRCNDPSSAAPPTLGADTAPARGQERQSQHHYRELISKHLGLMLDRLFAEFTGVHFHITWAPTDLGDWDARSLASGCLVGCRLTGSPMLPGCRACGPRQLDRALKAEGEGVRFLCRLGVRNYWMPIHLRGETLGIAYLQALHEPRFKPAKACGPGTEVVADRGGGAKVLSLEEFDRSARLLQFLIRSVQTSSLADLLKTDLTNARQAAIALEKELDDLQQAPDLYGRPRSRLARRPSNDTHGRQIVGQLLDVVAQHYDRPLTLRQCARDMGMSAAYLSDLFSHLAGRSFKAHLTATRVERAKRLLSDPKCSPSDAAFAVGYASENRFRAAFKQATGLPPRLWRETMKITPLGEERSLPDLRTGDHVGVDLEPLA